MKIGFYGDSFCSDLESNADYKTYIKKIVDYYNAEVVHLGIGGSSVWDLIINQFPKEQKDIPDVCIICWTSPWRFFHRTDRSLTYANFETKLDKELVNACKQYTIHLLDLEKCILEHKAAMIYFDHEILSNVKSKVIHLWGFGNNFEMKDYPGVYKFKNGIDDGISLRELADFKNKVPNHIYGEESNQKIFELIRTHIQ
jgi:hypothetical protein